MLRMSRLSRDGSADEEIAVGHLGLAGTIRHTRGHHRDVVDAVGLHVAADQRMGQGFKGIHAALRTRAPGEGDGAGADVASEVQHRVARMDSHVFGEVVRMKIGLLEDQDDPLEQRLLVFDRKIGTEVDAQTVEVEIVVRTSPSPQAAKDQLFTRRGRFRQRIDEGQALSHSEGVGAE